MTGKTLAGYIAGFIACWGLLAFVFFRSFGFNTAPALPFDVHRWQVAPKENEVESYRYRMVADLEARFLRLQMPRAQTRKLLGKPDATSEYDRQNHRDVYNLGNASGMAMDPSGLVLQFDIQGRLRQHYVMQF